MLAIIVALVLLLFAALAVWFGAAMIVGFVKGMVELPRTIRADREQRERGR